MSKLSKAILDTIHTKNIIPRSRWYFIGLHTVLWGFFIATLTIGIVAVGFMLLEIHMPERLYLDWIGDSYQAQLLRYFPYIWALGACICLGIGYFVFSKTERGYRVSTLWLVGALISGSLLGGYILYRTKFIEGGEKNIRYLIPQYEKMRSEFRKGILLPELGLLPGKIESFSGEVYIVKSPDKKIWKVTLKCETELCKKWQENPEFEKPILFRGQLVGKGQFEAINVETPKHRRGEQDKNMRLPHSIGQEE